MNTGATIFLAGMAFVALYLFLLPTVLAVRRRHHQRLAIIATNLLFGLTGFGWAVALIWSLTSVRKEVA